jgi:hypothetical protein
MSFGGSAYRTVESISIDVPYCDRCWTHVKRPHEGGAPPFNAIFVGFPLLAGLILGIIVWNRWSAISPGKRTLELCAAAILVVGGWITGKRYDRKDDAVMAAAISQQCANKTLAVTLTWGKDKTYAFGFANDDYAIAFAELNHGRILGLEQSRRLRKTS